MSIKIIPDFTGGVDNVNDAKVLPDNALQDAQNYDMDGDLKIRKDSDQYDSNLDTYLGNLFGTSILRLSPLWYPQKTITGIYGEFVVLVYGIDLGAYKLYAVYQNGASSWTSTQIDVATYTSSSDLTFFVGENRVLIADGVNKVHYCTVDNDGNIVDGFVGLPAPTNKIEFEDVTEYDSSEYEENSSNTYVTTPGLVQACYTVETEDGDVSNPSPISLTRDMQFIKLSSGADARWINKFLVKNLSIPVVGQDIEDKLKYFNIYIRVFKYSEPPASQNFEFVSQHEISDKTTSGTTTNEYTVATSPDPSELLSYENDVAPVAKDVAEVGGIVMVGNIKRKIEFPFEFKYYQEIQLNNLDNSAKVDAVVRMKLWDKDSGDSDAIASFEVDDYYDSADVTNSHHIRLFNNDLTTTLPIMLTSFLTGNYLDIYVKIPVIPPSSSHTIYLCWTPVADIASYGGVTTDYRTFLYGKIFDNVVSNVDDWADQIMFNSVRVVNNSTPICSPFDVPSNSTTAPNKANDTIPGSLLGTSVWVGSPLAYFPNTSSDTLGLNSVSMTAGIDVGIVYTAPFSGENLIVKKWSCFFVFNYDVDATLSGGTGRQICSLYTDGAHHYALKFYNDSGTWKFAVSEAGSYKIFEEIPVYQTAGGDKTYFICFSHDPDNVGGEYWHLFVFDLTSDLLYLSSNGSAGSVSMTDPDFVLGSSNGTKQYDQSVVLIGRYFDIGVDDDISTVFNIAHYMCYSENIIGRYLFGTNIVVNGTFDTDTDWNKGTGWSIGSGVASCDGTQMTNTSLTASVDPVTLNKKYFTKYTISNYTAGAVQIRLGTIQGTSHSANGTYCEEIYATAGTGLNLTGNAAFNADIDNVYVYEITDNQNITLSGTTETIEYKDEFNMVQWSDINKLNIPDLYFKRVTEPVVKTMPAPSFLGFDYINTFLIFTRNTINRFVLEGTASGWAADSKTLIKEIVQYGLLAKRSLVVTGQSVLWMSEVGVIKWDSQGFSTISHKRFDIPPLTTYRGVYVPNMNQYWLTVDGTTVYVYDLTLDIWLGTFTNLDIDDIIVYSGGGTIMDGNLLLNSSGGIEKYPGASDTSETPYIITKDFFMLDGVVSKLQVVFSGTCDALSTVNKMISGVDTAKTNTITGIKTNTWRGIPREKARGHVVNFKLSKPTAIKQFIFDYKEVTRLK